MLPQHRACSTFILTTMHFGILDNMATEGVAHFILDNVLGANAAMEL